LGGHGALDVKGREQKLARRGEEKKMGFHTRKLEVTKGRNTAEVGSDTLGRKDKPVIGLGSNCAQVVMFWWVNFGNGNRSQAEPRSLQTQKSLL